MVKINQSRPKDLCWQKRTSMTKHLIANKKCYNTINQRCMLSRCRWKNKWCSNNRCTTSRWCRCSNRWLSSNSKWRLCIKSNRINRCNRCWCLPSLCSNLQLWCNNSLWCSSSSPWCNSQWCNNNPWCNSLGCSSSNPWCNNSSKCKWCSSKCRPNNRCSNSSQSWCNLNSKDRLSQLTQAKLRVL